MMERMDQIQGMFVFMIIMVLHGYKWEKILMVKQIPTVVVRQFLYPLTEQG